VYVFAGVLRPASSASSSAPRARSAADRASDVFLAVLWLTFTVTGFRMARRAGSPTTAGG